MMDLPLSKLPPEVLPRFWSKITVTPHCWDWQAKSRIGDYGVFTVRAGVQRLAHRLSYEIHYGEAPPGRMVVRHRCDNPLCVNPDHLELGTHADNMRDKVRRGRT
ncbi:HNH endonuclease signature motif containing protein, partial [Pseudomonas sp. 2(2015)]|uniref:HNH endonuclease signature motif containing protein n=1 Tax=Pseudomonas sp. 2(2015) TaxID=1619950 RepID=UPI0012DFEDC7